MNDLGTFILSVGLLAFSALSFVAGHMSGHREADALHGWQHDKQPDDPPVIRTW